LSEPNSRLEPQVPDASDPVAAPLDVRETRLADGTKIVIVNGVPYANPNSDAARLDGAVDRLRSVAEDWGFSLVWLYVGLPVLAGLLLCIVALVGGAADLLSGLTASEILAPLIAIVLIAGVIAGVVIFVRGYPWGGKD
jgi:hypothetical protein